MVRFLGLKVKGENILDIESDEYSLLKDSVFYLNNKTNSLNDKEFLSYLINKFKSGFIDDDFFMLKKDCTVGEFQSFKQTYVLMPAFISMAIEMCLIENGIDIIKLSK